MKKITATYDRDSKRFHRFIIDEGQGVAGSVYVPKSEDVPKEVTIVFGVQKMTNRVREP